VTAPSFTGVRGVNLQRPHLLRAELVSNESGRYTEIKDGSIELNRYGLLCNSQIGLLPLGRRGFSIPNSYPL
jgi:hypothetical protein